jgi:hypothetical protein
MEPKENEKALTDKERGLIEQLLNQTCARAARVLAQLAEVQKEQAQAISLAERFRTAMKEEAGVLTLNPEQREAFRKIIGRHPLSLVESIYNKVLADPKES